MRDIKFRGITPTKKWIVGSLIYHGEQPRIEFVRKRHPIDNRVLATDWAYVDPKTVGQFTSLLDKNGKEVYEGDIATDGEFLYTVEFSTYSCGFVWSRHGSSNNFHFERIKDSEEMEVIGNIHDNSELLTK